MADVMKIASPFRRTLPQCSAHPTRWLYRPEQLNFAELEVGDLPGPVSFPVRSRPTLALASISPSASPWPCATTLHNRSFLRPSRYFDQSHRFAALLHPPPEAGSLVSFVFPCLPTPQQARMRRGSDENDRSGWYVADPASRLVSRRKNITFGFYDLQVAGTAKWKLRPRCAQLPLPKGSALKNLARALHAEAIRSTLSVGRRSQNGSSG